MPIRHVWWGVPRPLPTSLPSSSFGKLSIFFVKYVRNVFLLNLLQNSCFSLTVSLFWDVGSFSSFYNEGSHWKQTPSLLKIENIAYLLVPLTSTLQPCSKGQECCTQCISRPGLGRVVLPASREDCLIVYVCTMVEANRPLPGEAELLE